MPDSRPIFRPIVPVYDLLNRVLSLGLDQSWRRRAAAFLPRGRVLDIACGTGDLALSNADRPGTRVVGTDILPEMLQVAARKNAARKNAARKNAACKNAAAHGASLRGEGLVQGWIASAGERLPFRPASFEAITIAFGIRNFIDRDAGLREMARVLRPGGQLLILEFGVPTFAPFRALYLLYFKGLLPLVGWLVSGNDRAYTYLPETVLAFPEPEAFQREIEAAGFAVSRIDSLTLGIVRLYMASRPA